MLEAAFCLSCVSVWEENMPSWLVAVQSKYECEHFMQHRDNLHAWSLGMQHFRREMRCWRLFWMPRWIFKSRASLTSFMEFATLHLPITHRQYHVLKFTTKSTDHMMMLRGPGRFRKIPSVLDCPREHHLHIKNSVQSSISHLVHYILIYLEQAQIKLNNRNRHYDDCFHMFPQNRCVLTLSGQHMKCVTWAWWRCWAMRIWSRSKSGIPLIFLRSSHATCSSRRMLSW